MAMFGKVQKNHNTLPQPTAHGLKKKNFILHILTFMATLLNKDQVKFSELN